MSESSAPCCPPCRPHCTPGSCTEEEDPALHGTCKRRNRKSVSHLPLLLFIGYDVSRSPPQLSSPVVVLVLPPLPTPVHSTPPKASLPQVLIRRLPCHTCGKHVNRSTMRRTIKPALKNTAVLALWMTPVLTCSTFEGQVRMRRLLERYVPRVLIITAVVQQAFIRPPGGHCLPANRKQHLRHAFGRPGPLSLPTDETLFGKGSWAGPVRCTGCPRYHATSALHVIDIHRPSGEEARFKPSADITVMAAFHQP